MSALDDAYLWLAIKDKQKEQAEKQSTKVKKDENEKPGTLSYSIAKLKRNKETKTATAATTTSGWLRKKSRRFQDKNKSRSSDSAATANDDSVSSPHLETKKNETSRRRSSVRSIGSHVYTAPGSDSPLSAVSMSQSQSPPHYNKAAKQRQRQAADSSDDESDKEDTRTLKRAAASPAEKRKHSDSFNNNNNLQEPSDTNPKRKIMFQAPKYSWSKKNKPKVESSSSDSSDSSDSEEAPPKKPLAKSLANKKSIDSDSSADEKKPSPPKKQAVSPRISPSGDHTSKHGTGRKEGPLTPEGGAASKQCVPSEEEERSPKEKPSPERKETPNSSGKKNSLKRARKSSPPSNEKHRRKRPSNPFTLAQQEREENMRYAQNVPPIRFADGDPLWSDGEDDVFVNRAVSRNAPRRQQVHPPRAQDNDEPVPAQEIDQSGDIQMEVVEGGPRGPAQNVDHGKETQQFMADSESDSDSLDDEDIETRAAGVLHPDFKNPVFGPFECEPLSLSAQHQVPAALSRYLLDYQREGIQFLYDAIANGKGGLLLDDMGLGKTVQVIATIAAYLGKTGTDLDRVRIEQREPKIAKFKKYIEQRKEDGLCFGNILTPELEQEKIASFKMEKLGLAPLTPVLLVVPAVVVDNWDFEFSLWGHFSVARYREQDKRDIAVNDIKYGSAEIFLCSHSMFSKREHFNEINKISWKLVVVDEFHTFKTKKGDLSRNMRKLKGSSECPVVGLTGTPMQNRHEELYNLIDIVAPNYLGRWTDFKNKYSNPMKLSLAVNASKEVVEHGKKKQKELWTKLRPMYIQRFKTDVLKDMPEKFEKVVFCELSKLQKQIYSELLDKPDYILLRGANAPCDCGVNRNYFYEYKCLNTTEEKIDYQRKHKYVKRKKCCYKTPVAYRGGPIQEDAVLWKHQHPPDESSCESCPSCVFLPALTKLYQLSSHVSLLQVDRNDRSENRGKQEAFALTIRNRLPNGDIYRQDSCLDDHFEMSGKMLQLHRVLRAIVRKGGRVLLFSYSTKTLDVIENYLKMESHMYLRIDGSTPAKDRQGLVNTFQTDASYLVMLLSTRAAGVGLNLTAADNVIIFDCEWNPALDAQAQDRSFRIGQKKDVTVYRLIAQGTIDELKYLRQIYKLQLKDETFRPADGSSAKAPPKSFKGVEKDKDRKGELFGMENLLSFKDDGCFMEKVWKTAPHKPGSAVGSAISDVVIAHDAIELARALQMGDANMLDQEQEFIAALTEKCTELFQEGARIQDHGDFLSEGRVVAHDNPDHIMGGCSQLNDDFVNRYFQDHDLEDETIEHKTTASDADAPSPKQKQSDLALSASAVPGTDVSNNRETMPGLIPTQSPSNQIPRQSTSNSTPILPSSNPFPVQHPSKKATSGKSVVSNNNNKKKTSPSKKNNFKICGITADQIRNKKATFGKADFFLPNKKKKS